MAPPTPLALMKRVSPRLSASTSISNSQMFSECFLHPVIRTVASQRICVVATTIETATETTETAIAATLILNDASITTTLLDHRSPECSRLHVQIKESTVSQQTTSPNAHTQGAAHCLAAQVAS